MRSALAMVEAFRRKVGLPAGDARTPKVTRPELHLRLIREEVQELDDAVNAPGGPDVVGAADALADIIFLAIGAAIEWAVPIVEVFAEVSRSNLTKERGNVRGDGKILKGPHYQPPRIGEVMRLVAARAIGEQAGHEGADLVARNAERPERVVYLAAPVAPPCVCANGHNVPKSALRSRMVECNCERARRWLSWAIAQHPDTAFCASWLPYLDVLEDEGEGGHNRERGMRDNIATAVRCDEIWLVGGRISRGMARERDAMVAAGRRVVDMTALGHEPPELG